MQRTPGFYGDIKVNLQRNQLPNQAHKIIFVNTDVPKDIPPTPIFDTAEADTKAKPRSNAGRMMAAALMVSQAVDVEMVTQVGLRDGVLCEPYNHPFALPLSADGTASVTVYYNHDLKLKQASVTVSSSQPTAYAFLGEHQPSPNKDVFGCALLVGRLQPDDTVVFSVHGFTKTAEFDDEQYSAVDVLLEIKPYLTRKEIKIDKGFYFIDAIPADEAGMASADGDVYPHLRESFVNSCSELYLLTPDGGGDPPPDGGDGTGGDDGGDGTGGDDGGGGSDSGGSGDGGTGDGNDSGGTDGGYTGGITGNGITGPNSDFVIKFELASRPFGSSTGDITFTSFDYNDFSSTKAATLQQIQSVKPEYEKGLENSYPDRTIGDFVWGDTEFMVHFYHPYNSIPYDPLVRGSAGDITHEAMLTEGYRGVKHPARYMPENYQLLYFNKRDGVYWRRLDNWIFKTKTELSYTVYNVDGTSYRESRKMSYDLQLKEIIYWLPSLP